MKRYLVQLSIKIDHYLYNMWDHIEEFETLEEAEEICRDLFDNSVHKLQISDKVNNKIIKTWQ